MITEDQTPTYNTSQKGTFGQYTLTLPPPSSFLQGLCLEIGHLEPLGSVDSQCDVENSWKPHFWPKPTDHGPVT